MRGLVALAAALLVLSPWHATAQAPYPARPVKIVAPALPGGGVDLIARTVADQLGRAMEQSFVVENLGGGGGAIASVAVARAAPDGYTLMIGYVATHATNPAVRKVPYDPVRDFTPIAMVGGTPNILVLGPAVPPAHMQELLAYAKANAGKLSFGTGGMGTLTHLAIEQFRAAAGIDAVPVHYRSIAPALTDLLGGQIDFALLTPITIAAHLGSDKMKIIGITAPARHPMLPDAPTLREAGLPQATATVWYGLFGPARLPAPVLERLRREIAVVVEQPAVRDKLAAAGLQMAPQLGEDFERACVNEFRQWEALVKAEGLVVQD